MQRLENMRLLGSAASVVRPAPDRSLAAMVARAHAEHPAPAPVAAAVVAPPRVRRSRLETRPAGARLDGRDAAGELVRSDGFSALVRRVRDNDPVLMADLRRNPQRALELRDLVERLLVVL